MTVLRWSSLVCLMHVWNGCRVGPGRTVRTFICSALYAIELGGVIGDRCSLWGRNRTLVYNIFVRWMYEMGVVLARPGWTARTLILLEYVLLVIDSVWSRNLTFTRCLNTLQWWWRLCVDLRLLNVWNGVVLSLGKQLVRLYCFVSARIWHLLLMFDPLCDRNHLTRMWCPNTLQWWWRLCVYLP